jgi:DNA-binding NarL/FixJ family response regulator
VKTAQIARQLHLSVKTVETYRDRIRQKLDLSDGTKLAHLATQCVLEFPQNATSSRKKNSSKAQ